jgi:hypothetical protein
MKGNQNKKAAALGIAAALHQPMSTASALWHDPSVCYMVLPCFVMGPDGSTWERRDVRVNPDNIEQYFEGIVHNGTTCLIMTSGNIALCIWNINVFEAALASYRLYAYQNEPTVSYTFIPPIK